MATQSLADAMQVFFEDNTGLDNKHSLNDLQFSYYSSRSGLSPIWKYSLTDHMRTFFKAQGASGSSIDELERNYYQSLGAIGKSYQDVKYDFYTGQGVVFVVDNGDGTITINTSLAPVTDNGDGTIYVGPPGIVANNGDGTLNIHL